MQLQKPSVDNDPLQNGAILAPYAELAYYPNAITHQPQWASIEAFSCKNASGFVAFEHKIKEQPKVVVAIAGTNDFVDAKQDLDIQAVKLNKSRLEVHNGFMDHAIQVRSALKPWHGLLADAEVWLVGHSLGGAAAILLPLALELSIDTRIFVWGAPPAIKQGQGGHYVRPVVRFAHINDLVPKAYRKKYEHVGRPFWIRSSGKVSGSPSFFHRAWGLMVKVARMLTSGIATANKHYHSMTRYRENLEAAE